jgi:peptidoglycan/LPS O-acetylase OafA/YrhL
VPAARPHGPSLSPSPRTPDLHGHLPVLDGLRGLAILLVLVHHFNILHPAGPLERELIRLFDLGKHGVDLFFVLSGFLITGLLLDAKGSPGYFRNFYARRTLRIFPLYYATLAFFLLVLPAWYGRETATLPLAMRWGLEADIWPWYFGYASNIQFALREGFGPAGLDITWSLAIEEQFYLLWAPLVFFVPARVLPWVCAALMALGPIVRAAIGAGGGTWLDAYLLTPGRLDALAAGGFLAAWLRRPAPDVPRVLRTAAWVLAGAGALLAFLHVGAWLNGFTAPGVTLGLSAVALVSAAGLVLLLHAPAAHPLSRIFESRVLALFGRYSYGLYLVNIPVRDLLRRHVFPADAAASLSGAALLAHQALVLVATTLAALAAAWLVRRLIEEPFLKLKRFFPRAARTG